jgi:hypothetical protein
MMKAVPRGFSYYLLSLNSYQVLIKDRVPYLAVDICYPELSLVVLYLLRLIVVIQSLVGFLVKVFLYA